MADWCYTFDFTKDRYDFTGYIAASNRARDVWELIGHNAPVQNARCLPAQR